MIGFTGDARPDTDLFLSRAVGGPATPATSQPVTGGIQLIE